MTEFPIALVGWLIDFPRPWIPACIDRRVVDWWWWLRLFLPSSLSHQSTPDQSTRSLIYSHRFDVNRPMDLNILLSCAWMMSEKCSCQPSTPSDYSWLTGGITHLRMNTFVIVYPFLSWSSCYPLVWWNELCVFNALPGNNLILHF